MMRERTFILGMWSSLVLWGCTCQQNLPPDSPPPANPGDSTMDTNGETGDPAVCVSPEVESNNIEKQASILPMETQGCGNFYEPGDVDYWSFDMPESSWLGLSVDAMSLGSDADVTIILTSDGGVLAERDNDPESRDASLLFPSAADHYTLVIREDNTQGDEEHYFYEVLATSAKAPIDPSMWELEPNNTKEDAVVVSNGDLVMGTVSDQFDSDWYGIVIPPGAHVFTINVEAFALGSPADVTLYLKDEDESPAQGCGQCIFTVGELGYERDPYLRYESSGQETLYVRVEEAVNRSGTAYWYVLDVGLEAQ